MIAALIAAVIAGAIFRRWWGDAAASWWPWKRANGTNIGYRGFRAVTGFVTLGAVCLLAGHPWWSAAIRAGFAIGFLTAMAQSIPHVWAAWDWLDGKLPRGLPKLGRWFTGHTTYSEATCGGIVWAFAVLL